MATVIKDVQQQEVLGHVMSVLESNIASIDEVIKIYESGNHLRKIWWGDQMVLSAFPCITLEPLSNTLTWGATNYTQENTYTLRIFCYVKNIAKEIMVQYLVAFAEVVRRILTHPDTLQFTTASGSVYDSWVSSVIFGTKEGGALRVAQLDYSATSWSPGIKA